MSENLHHVETYKRSDGKHAWRVTVGGDIVATDHGQGYENKSDCLASLFGLWFGTWDESFLGLYQEWQAGGGEKPSNPPEAQDGPPVHIQPDADAPNYEDVAEGDSATPEAKPDDGINDA